jgi:transposase InsO family protein
VKNLCTRKIEGYAFSGRIDTQLTLAALDMAYRRRWPAKGIISTISFRFFLRFTVRFLGRAQYAHQTLQPPPTFVGGG